MKEIANLIGGLSAEVQDLAREMRENVARHDAMLELHRNRLERQGGLLQTGSRWVNRMNQWAERVDRIFDQHDRRLDRLERPGNGHPA
jgi:hypothetical protein